MQPMDLDASEATSNHGSRPAGEEVFLIAGRESLQAIALPLSS